MRNPHSTLLLLLSFTFYDGTAFQINPKLNQCYWKPSTPFVSATDSPTDLSCLSKLNSFRKKNINKYVLFSQSKNGEEIDDFLKENEEDETKPDGDLETLMKQFKAFREMAWPYFDESTQAKWLFAGMVSFNLFQGKHVYLMNLTINCSSTFDQIIAL